MRIAFFVFTLVLISNAFSQNNNIPAGRDTSDFLGRIIFSQYCDSFPQIYCFPEWYHLQLVYVQIDRDEKQVPHFTFHRHGVNDQAYFYPASLVKWPTLLMTLEWLNEMKPKYGVDKYSKLELLKAKKCQNDFKEDTSGIEDYPCVANFIRKILIASDNQSFNALFDILGQDYINGRLRAMGYKRPVIVRNFAGCQDENFRFTRGLCFYDKNDKVILRLPSKEMKKNWIPACRNMTVGKGYYSSGKLIESPMDFSTNNYLPLDDILDMFMRFLFPGEYKTDQRWKLSPLDRLFLLQYLSVYPRFAPLPQYHNYAKFEDSYKKYFMFGETKDSIQNHDLKIFNIVGMSYGFASDIAYIVDLKEGVEFVVAGVIYVNQDEILGDDKYEYRPTAWQFYTRLGKILYRYELERKKKIKPDFKEIRTALGMPFL